MLPLILNLNIEDNRTYFTVLSIDGVVS